MVQNTIHRPVNASQLLNPLSFGVVSERIQRESRNVIVDPIDRARIACPRVRFEVVNTHASQGHTGIRECLSSTQMSHPRSLAGVRWMETTNAFSAGIDAVRSGRPTLEIKRVIASGGFRDAEITRLSAFPSRKYLAICPPYAAGPSNVATASPSRSSTVSDVVAMCFDLRKVKLRENINSLSSPLN